MDFYDSLPCISEDECFRAFLSGIGYDKAQEFGLLRQYMKMMNNGGSGGYTDHHFKKAEISDVLNYSLEWRLKEMEYLKSLYKKIPPA